MLSLLMSKSFSSDRAWIVTRLRPSAVKTPRRKVKYDSYARTHSLMSIIVPFANALYYNQSYDITDGMGLGMIMSPMRRRV